MLGPERFNTIIGVVFLVIVLLSPGGLVGLWERARELLTPKTRAPAGAGGDRGRGELTLEETSERTEEGTQ